MDILYLAFRSADHPSRQGKADNPVRHNPTFVLPTFSDSAPSVLPSTGRHTGTGSAQIATSLPQPLLLGYMPLSLPALLARTGSLPPTASHIPVGIYKTLRDARRRERAPVCLLPEGTTSNGRALLRFGEGMLGEGDIGGEDEGIVWIKHIRPVRSVVKIAQADLQQTLHSYTLCPKRYLSPSSATNASLPFTPLDTYNPSP